MKPNNPRRKLREVFKVVEDVEGASRAALAGLCEFLETKGKHGPEDPCPTGFCYKYGSCSNRDDRIRPWLSLKEEQREEWRQVARAVLGLVRAELKPEKGENDA